jgi:hypothetical protein
MLDGFDGLAADVGQIRRFADTLFRYADEGTVVSLRSFYDDRDGVFHIKGHQIGRDQEALVPTIAESRVMIRQWDEQTDSPGDSDHLDDRGAQSARSAGWLA